MRALVLAALAACSAPAHTGGHGGGAPPAGDVDPHYVATRWFPAAPTYAIASTKLTDIQRTIKDAVASFGLLGGVSEADVGGGLASLLGVNPLSTDALRGAGIDPEGGFSMFSDALDPTLAVHLSDPAAFAAFVEKQRGAGMVSQSVVVDGVEQFTFKARDVGLSWAVVDDWLLVHVLIPGVHDDNKGWLEASRHRGKAGWLDAWQWANRVAGRAASVIGVVSVQQLVALGKRGADAVACFQLFDGVRYTGLSVEGDGSHVRGRVAFELGASASKVYGALLPPPQGWDLASKGAPISAGWNLDTLALAGWLAPCAKAFELGDLKSLTMGIRAARAFATEVNLKDTSGVGAIALDGDASYLRAQLDRIPMRGTLEKDRTWNGVAGKHLGIPFGPAFDYVLDDKRAVIAMGDGVMDKVFANDKPAPRLAYLDVVPGGLPHDVWKSLFELAGLGHRSLAMFEAWRDGHLSLAMEGSALVLEARGNRR